MKKIIIFLLAFFAIFSQTNAARYGGARVAKTIGDGATWCPTDGDTTGGSPTVYPGHGFGNYSYDSKVTAESGNNMYCQFWDGYAPVNPTTLTLSNVKNFDGSNCNPIGDTYYCKKSSINMNYNWTNGTDQGGSGIKTNGYQYVFQRVSDQYWVQDGYGSSGKYVSVSGLTQGTYVTWIRSFDNAGNANPNFTRGPYIVIDTTAPTASDIGDTNPANGSHLLAVNSQSFSLSVNSGGGSPIVDIDGKFENYATPTSYDLVTSSNSNLTFTKSIQSVDNNRVNGSRTYNFYLTNVCDAAGNCLSGANIKNYNYYVYANTTNITTKSVTQNQITNNSNVADGTLKNLKITLEDLYQNAIVPAPAIGRTIDVNFNSVTNSMYLDQYNGTGAKSVYVSKANQSTYSNVLLQGGNASINGETPTTNGDYIYGFKFYTPTANSAQNAVSDPNAVFSIGNITFDVNGTYGVSNQNVLGSNNIIANYKPLYQTSISGEYVSEGFIEGNMQTGNLTRITTTLGNESGVIGSTRKIYLKFGGLASSKYELKATGGNLNSTVVSEGSLATDYGFNSGNLNTLMQLTASPAPSSINVNLSTHISYNIDGHDVVYNSFVVGQNGYNGTVITTQQANQSGLKVIGTTYSKAGIQNIVDNQTTVSIGKFDKSSTKLSIIKNAYAFAKNLSSSSSDNINNIDNPGVGFKEINNIIYFGGESGNGTDKKYTLGNGGNISVSKNKTILVIGGSLYIKSNIDYSGDGMLGIVVLKDNDGNGGNVYIDPGVTNISANIFAEKSLISYNGTTELDGSTPASTLKNQLHIYGSVFSYNTIGGSAKNPLECPYYVPSSSCSSKSQAQKYDFNYLRRYYLKDTDGNGVGDTPANGGLSNYNSGETNYKYPVIIEYNTNIQKNPPPLFSD